MARRGVTTIDLSGPFFEADPSKTFRQNVRLMLDALAEEGERDVKAQLAQGEPRRYPLGMGLGRVSRHAIGRTRALDNKQWAMTAVISVNNSGLTPVQGIKLMAAASYLEGEVHAFRRTAGRLRRARAINTAELAKGL